ncbi:MAG: pyruvate dehydrogenase complex dihydrolipoamide acetyltransferase [Rhodospirillales bacterium]|nr:pyruvate dehydrogenase complex dihydrolipoamide acetyltransferase [Rhodospirillales bacterium]
MATTITMPALSPTMTEGTLARWVKQIGDTVAAGDVICEIETDKATMEVEAVDDGRLAKILVEEGSENVAINTPIALLAEEGESVETAAQGAAVAAKPPVVPAAVVAASAPASAPVAQAVPGPAPAAAATAAGGRIFASPLAKRMAGQTGLDLALITGSGPHGRIVKTDIEAAIASGTGKADVAIPEAMPVPVTAPAPAAAYGGPVGIAFAETMGIPHRVEKLSAMRKVIAQRLTESKQQVPHFYLTVDCQIDSLLKIRKELNEKPTKAGRGGKISVNDFVIRAVALALGEVPAANAAYDPAGLVFFERADVSVAVATPAGLITPIVKDAGAKGLATIAAETKNLAARAREGKLQPADYQGGTFSVSNLGMFAIKQFEAVINPPQGCILAVGAGEERAVVKEGALAIATVMSCTLSVDHRVVDGAVGAEFLAAFKRLIEDPITMLL